MANEGSTKPTYSELEAENLRVRGLLQRGKELLQSASTILGDPWIEQRYEWIQDLQLVSQGAESADDWNHRWILDEGARREG